MLEGLIVKALSGYYYVKPMQDGNIISGEDPAVQCRARGIFKRKASLRSLEITLCIH